MKKKMVKSVPLCFRCENRALFLETGNAPRCECKDPTSSAYGCYAYKPVKPLWVKRAKGDRRPVGGGLFGSRVNGVKVSDGDYRLVSQKNKHLIYFSYTKGII